MIDKIRNKLSLFFLWLAQVLEPNVKANSISEYLAHQALGNKTAEPVVKDESNIKKDLGVLHPDADGDFFLQGENPPLEKILVSEDGQLYTRGDKDQVVHVDPGTVANSEYLRALVRDLRRTRTVSSDYPS